MHDLNVSRQWLLNVYTAGWRGRFHDGGLVAGSLLLKYLRSASPVFSRACSVELQHYHDDSYIDEARVRNENRIFCGMIIELSLALSKQESFV